MDQIYTTLKTFGNVKTNVPMSRYTTFKIGGPAKYLLTVSSTQNLIAVLMYLDAEGIDYLLLGGGSNMLVGDSGFDGVVIKVASNTYKVEGTTFIADAGCPTVFVAQESMKAGLTGFEWGVGVPGTIGGAVRGNAGAMGKEMKDNVVSVDVYKDGEVVTLANDACHFSYRHSRFKESGEVVLTVRLALTPYTSKEEQIESRKKMLEFLKYRNETQPKGFASTGCIFKNVDINVQDTYNNIQKDRAMKNRTLLLQHFDEGDEKIQQFLRVGKISAGWLVEQAGLKGKTCGGAEISPVHGNFIVNTGTATAADVLSLIDEIKQAVYTTYGITLEEEMQIV